MMSEGQFQHDPFWFSRAYLLVYIFLLFCFSAWTLLAYVGIYYSQSVVYVVALSFTLFFLATKLHNENYCIRVLNSGPLRGLVFSAFLVFLAGIFPVVNLMLQAHTGVLSIIATYFVGASNGICLVILLYLISQAKTEPVIAGMRTLYVFVFIVNLLVSLVQYILFKFDVVSVSVFSENPRLAAIMMPGYGVGDAQLRVPGVFWNGGTNGIFNAIGFIYIVSEYFRVRRVSSGQLLIIASSCLIIYLTFTRRVWIALVAAFAFSAFISFLHRTNLKRKVLACCLGVFGIFLGFSTLLAWLISSRISQEIQMLNPESMLERFFEWQHYFSLISNSSNIQMIFGHGVLQELFHLYEHNFLFVDNIIASLVLYSGIFGIFSYAVLYFTLFFRSIEFLNFESMGRPVYFIPSLLVFSFVVSMFQNFWSDFYTAVTLYFVCLPFIVYCYPLRRGTSLGISAGGRND